MHEFFSHLFVYLKPLVLVAIAGIASLFSPIREALYVLGLSFCFNIITGIVADVHVNKKDFCIKKAFEAIVQLTFFGALIFFIHNVAASLQDFEIGKTGVKWATYIVVYFYFTNILRNATLIFPKTKAISFMYMILTTEVFKRLKEMMGVKTSECIDETIGGDKL